MMVSPSIFISYSQDSIEHKDRVLNFSDRLRDDGVDANIDQYQVAPPEGWLLWMEKQIRDSNNVLLVCTETYLRRVMKEDSGKGLGVMWESTIIYHHLYNSGVLNKKFIPVIFGYENVQYIPSPLQSSTFYDISTEDGYELLYRRLTNQPYITKPKLGAKKKLASRELKQEISEIKGPLTGFPLVDLTSFETVGRLQHLNKIPKTPSVFISYSHKDEEWKKRLETHLDVLEMQELLSVWEDRQIETGDDWYPEIENAINHATIALLMISANFLTSEFILGKEVQKLLERRKKEGMRIIPVIVKPCAWTRVGWLSKIQAWPKDGRALSAGNEYQIDADLSALVEEIAHIIERTTLTPVKQNPIGHLSISKVLKEQYKEYSKDIWDYASDMPYLPSRSDRDGLIKSGDSKHVMIWDYFFRIKPEDVGKPQLNEIETLKNILKEEKLQSAQKSNVLKRIYVLELEIADLKKQIPISPSNAQVREWLHQDFKTLWGRSKDVTALGNRLIDIASNETKGDDDYIRYPNPVVVLGPAELQRPEEIPLVFKRNIDLTKHFFACRSFHMPTGDTVEVLYGIYYLEHILIADDMFATYGLFFDFISGKYHAEKITEQYYKDVVAISIAHEFREISLDINGVNRRYVEDTPTFTFSLASGECHTASFVGYKYFMEIREKINISEDDVSRIYWTVDARESVNTAVRVMRSQLRLHKETPNKDEN